MSESEYVMVMIKEIKQDIKEIKDTTKNIEISMARTQDKVSSHETKLSQHSLDIDNIKRDINKKNFWYNFFGENSWVQKIIKYIIIASLIIFLIRTGYDVSNFVKLLGV